ncbi:hypothetical protein HanXRQr2_Chr01g0001381 [Helianthus annuus]|uniref:Uncharacterized protein n=1 Tax=Helianthus annuus TaxID=4232 RepID=A0A9K3JRB3_HELAN|nr:hypothetical protein HanXRQr2_Chr01g0001381 [Helianthus annuus]KAJ0610204.1 hypothetical protein HanHA300_Chr01g0001231 [Helianthus annuus]KAJ0625409.1 hypothetical protein HanHA89_Chr01g0001321 [Helianthus annuus]KAJ0781829.1 hypothetical protein HanLR1_Chr01g0001241 [Helianthus annuus]KAJ0955306.1 hypothetical protein HanPSC8_Chr01g0001361 [Helianthus annuus]
MINQIVWQWAAFLTTNIYYQQTCEFQAEKEPSATRINTSTISPVIKTEKSNGDVATSSPHQHEPGPVNGTATADVYEEYKLTVTSYFPNCVYEDLTLISDDCKITSITKLSLLAHIRQLLHCVLLTYNYGTVVRCNRSHVVRYMLTNLYLVEPEFACFTRTVVAGYTRVNWVARK